MRSCILSRVRQLEIPCGYGCVHGDRGVLRAAGRETVHLRDLGLHKLPDDKILSLAAEQESIVLTFDLDFGELLAATGGSSPSVILFRMRNQTPTAVNPGLFEVLETCQNELVRGALVLVEDRAYRLRRLPIRPM